MIRRRPVSLSANGAECYCADARLLLFLAQPATICTRTPIGRSNCQNMPSAGTVLLFQLQLHQQKLAQLKEEEDAAAALERLFRCST